MYASGNAEIGGPVGLDTGFSVVGHGAPPPPRPHNYGWNDGPARATRRRTGWARRPGGLERTAASGWVEPAVGRTAA
ncbi:hypothetical protein I550_0351 [Mycobacterium intracellulare 1956]|uniref:Uncharacterized protein n=1 Tax=Mycobacterium intracellulare 1956 TaxID=1299331 RepID=X8CN15_MYCIT|nr:hypothetical protein I550_0351 [Mycobacterium intracellulare 1956]